MSDYHNHQKKIALINDMTGFGRCSIAVALPVISMLRVQCCALPTAIFSNHTGFESFYYQDYTDHMQPSINEWKKLGLEFSGICTGFLGSARQIAIVSDFIRDFKRPDNLVIIDPVMGDYGKPYPTYTKEMCDHMKDLVCYADILTPNMTEACILTDTPYEDKKWHLFRDRSHGCQTLRKRPIQDCYHRHHAGPVRGQFLLRSRQAIQSTQNPQDWYIPLRYRRHLYSDHCCRCR